MPAAAEKTEKLRPHSRAKPRKLSDKKALVMKGRSHGVLVFRNGEPVGWCQYGRAEELPRIDDDPNYRGLAPKNTERLWRIPCFVVNSAIGDMVSEASR